MSALVCVRIAAVSAVVMACTAPALAQTSEPMRWSVTPYLWAANTRADLQVRGSSISDELSFEDLLDVLDTSFMLHVEAGGGRWTAFGDVSYLEMSDSSARPLLTIDSRNKQLFLDLASVYWPGGVGAPLGLIGGVRVSRFDDRYRFYLGDQLLREQRTDSDYVDLLLGVRYTFELGSRWAIRTHADFSVGDSEGTIVARLSFAYSLAQERFHILFGYQYKNAEYVEGESRTEYTYDGPIGGLEFRF